MKIRNYLLALVFVVACFTTNVQAKENVKTVALTEVRVMEIQKRVNEIRAMDLTNLTRAQRKDIKHELKDMKLELGAADPTVIYISAGGLLLIIILILLLI